MRSGRARSTRAAPVVALVAGALLWSGCGGTARTPATSPTDTSTGSSTGTATTPGQAPSSSSSTSRGTTPGPTTPRPSPSTRPTSPTPSRTSSTSRPPTTSPTPTLPPALADGVVTRIPTSRKVVALTFDGGAGSQGAASILSTLRSQGVPASFFVTGEFATANPALVRQMAAVGPVGNHTWDHPHLTSLSDTAVRTELSRAESAVRAATGRTPRPFFRFPFGEYSSRTLALVHSSGYGAVGWTTDSLGWKGTSGGQSVDSVVARVLAGRTPGQVVLMHVGANPDDGTTLDAAALARVIAGYRAAGYGFTTLDALR